MTIFYLKKFWPGAGVLVAQAYNPSYSGGRDQEDPGLKPDRVNSSQDPILKNPSQKKKKKRVVEWLKV
jgi:hypothetical protein